MLLGWSGVTICFMNVIGLIRLNMLQVVSKLHLPGETYDENWFKTCSQHTARQEYQTTHPFAQRDSLTRHSLGVRHVVICYRCEQFLLVFTIKWWLQSTFGRSRHVITFAHALSLSKWLHYKWTCSCSMSVCFSCFMNSQKVQQEGITQVHPYADTYNFQAFLWTLLANHPFSRH